MIRTSGDKKRLSYEKENGRDRADISIFTGAGGDKVLMERMRRGEARLKEVRIQVSDNASFVPSHCYALTRSHHELPSPFSF